jgi:TRAP-type C4-dicarboxylate transport system permease small subunit
MAHTLKRNEHIRVTILVHALSGGARRAIELWSLAAATFLSGALAWFAVRLVLQSREFNDISTGNDATPLWLPQLSFAIGALVLLVAFVDELVLEVRGQRRAPTDGAEGELLRNE